MHPIDGLKKNIECQILSNKDEVKKLKAKGDVRQAYAVECEVGRLESYLKALKQLEEGVEATTLKPCPFCGSSNVGYEFAGSQGTIDCHSCGAIGPSVEQAADPHCDVDAAFIAWNRRR
ncbi:Lar family restriction alleviation protein (plasmid) [Vibrio parahaemolyticus]